MRVIPRLNLNQNPQNGEEVSIMFTTNERGASAGSLVADFGHHTLSGL